MHACTNQIKFSNSRRYFQVDAQVIAGDMQVYTHFILIQERSQTREGFVWRLYMLCLQEEFLVQCSGGGSL